MEFMIYQKRQQVVQASCWGPCQKALKPVEMDEKETLSVPNYLLGKWSC
jgi:hypothetical protein